ncbi:CobQ/CobB/MinD/ParA nucleotide binding domain-containing protein [Nocardia amikacinitolerans]|uniref:CobQ/CobB/MinD/ParA nucleotide binding domain-containing protein n=1 Tax=Nocardia amikacinitolerans TaxID=756689 RepID=A0A285LRW5_9NOCA|nr:AAA family ATPase [Nocardia amikacinitolerans]SNY87639.1 CobQ/CobB/MinD/ParA nucleotide binding domain-containing protein [Nocardia amikacinitolerans]
MAKVIALFNNKGGVSKTTTCFNLGWMLASLGKKVIMVDADPQCNLTGMVLDLSGEDALERFYKDNPGRNLKEALEPAFKSRPVALKPVECVEVEGQSGLFLIPGHVALSEDETSLGIAQQLSESLQGLRNLPGSFTHLFQITADRYGADYVLLDLSPGLGAINQNLVATSDFFLVPCSPDVFSVMAVDSLSRVIPRWLSWAQRAAKLDTLADADYPFPEPDLKFLGVLVQRFRIKSGRPTEAFKKYFDKLDAAVKEILVPSLERGELMLKAEHYHSVGMSNNHRLAEIQDFNTLIASSQHLRKPVFALTKDDLQRRGNVWDAQEVNIVKFRETFQQLAERIIKLTA